MNFEWVFGISLLKLATFHCSEVINPFVARVSINKSDFMSTNREKNIWSLRFTSSHWLVACVYRIAKNQSVGLIIQIIWIGHASSSTLSSSSSSSLHRPHSGCLIKTDCTFCYPQNPLHLVYFQMWSYSFYSHRLGLWTFQTIETNYTLFEMRTKKWNEKNGLRKKMSGIPRVAI